VFADDRIVPGAHSKVHVPTGNVRNRRPQQIQTVQIARISQNGPRQALRLRSAGLVIRSEHRSQVGVFLQHFRVENLRDGLSVLAQHRQR
jgi:hypothetical protein